MVMVHGVDVGRWHSVGVWASELVSGLDVLAPVDPSHLALPLNLSFDAGQAKRGTPHFSLSTITAETAATVLATERRLVADKLRHLAQSFVHSAGE